MAKNFRYKHINSAVADKTPSVMFEGEIAVNRFAGKEKLFIKNTNQGIVDFVPRHTVEDSINAATSGKVNTSTFNTHTASTVHMTTTEKTNLDSLATNIAAISGITSTKIGNWDNASSSSHSHNNKAAIDSITGTVGTMAYQATSSYSSATQVNTALGNKVDKVSGKGLSTNDYTTDDKNKLSAIASGAEVNQNAFSNIKVGSTTVAADSKTDTLEIAGSGIVSVTADATNDKITISASNAVTSVAGKTGAVTLAKGDVGLGNVDNTADANKTVKAATSAQTADLAKAVALSGVSNADDLKAIEALTGTSGFLKKTAANTWSLDTNTYSKTSVAVTGATYNSTNKTIDLKNAAGTVVSSVDATAFIKDGMVSNVEVKDVASSGTCLVITFNTDAGKDAINIPISQIFDANNYYTKTELTGSSTTVVVAKASSASTAANASSVALSNVSGADDLKKIEALTGTSGLLKKTAANTWTLDTTDYSNKNAFGKIKINAESTTIDSDTTNDTLTISGGSFVTLTSDAANDKFTIGVSTGTTSATIARGDHNHDSVYQAKGSYLTGTTKYASSSTQGGAATSAEKLTNTSAIGSATNPVFFTANGVPSATTYTLGKSVPSNAVFTDTDTKVTAVGNHYAPTATSADTKSAAASSTSELNWGSAVVTGVTLSGDAKGHITSVTVASGKLKTPVTGVTLASGTNNGTVKLTVNGSATDNIAVKGINTMAYQATSSYSSATQVNTALGGKSNTGHTHDDRYYTESELTGSSTTVVVAKAASATTAASAGAVAWGNVSGKPSSYTPSSHNQASNTITAMTSYSKPSTTSAIASGDTLNAAIGKLEKALDGKQASGNYLTSHQTVTLASGTNNGTLKITTAAGTTDNVAVKGINTMAYQATGSYSSATQVNTALAGKSDTGHTHDGTYAKNAFSRITVNTTNVDADTTGDTFTITAGSFVSLTGDATNDKLTIGVSTGTTSSTLARGDHSHSNYVPTGRTITTASGLTGGGNLSADRTIGLSATGTAGTYGPTANVTGTEGTTIKIPQITTDAYGRVTSVTERTLTNKNATYTVNNGTFTISGNGTSVASTSANASANSGLNIKSGSNVTITTGTNEITIAATDTGGFNVLTNPTASTNVGLVNKLSQYYDTNIGKGAVIEGDGINSQLLISASGNYSHAEGLFTSATSEASHAEGAKTIANGSGSHAEGYNTTASGIYGSHAEGRETTASGYSSHAEGSGTTASGDRSHSEGQGTTANGSGSHAEGYSSTASGSYSHAEGEGTTASGQSSHAEGYSTTASGNYSHAEGTLTTASGYSSHAEGYLTKANGSYSHAEGANTIASGQASHSEGYSTQASGDKSHAEGNTTIASGESSHAEGYNAKTYGQYSHAEGYMSIASGKSSHAEGWQSKASGAQSHAEGVGTQASGEYSHAEGNGTIASGQASHAEGYSTRAYNFSEHASGQYNVSSSASTTFGNSGNTLFSVGNGTSNSNRKNAFEIRQNGDIYIVNSGSTVKLQDLIGDIETLLAAI